MTRDDAWFFDTELLLLAEHNGLRVVLPLRWIRGRARARRNRSTGRRLRPVPLCRAAGSWPCSGCRRRSGHAERAWSTRALARRTPADGAHTAGVNA
ncbi:hypothetical protein IOD14_26415 [Streptomyces sp. A2-16]|uniref:hypothetical protein n=1 Tax=Streptomyces sp. A2-16 TaxID=2781734 RepID=UPI001BAFF7C2|nr:hypothetical protein [Streptomyces sp. A2-16]QUC60004.1 hypothetical protein IOD14_26415 [Streptomyces sp. A2-16]